MRIQRRAAKQGLYDPRYEHDACGMGFVVSIKGEASHEIVEEALTVLENLTHRGASGADIHTGDGAGILFQLPHAFFLRHAQSWDMVLPEQGDYGVGMLFMHRYEGHRQIQQETFSELANELGMKVLGWREVSINRSHAGETALQAMPSFWQVFLKRPEALKDEMAFERRLFLLRKQAEARLYPQAKEAGGTFYVASLSCRTIVYKGMLTARQLRSFFLDLADLSLVSALAMVHSRFSTNTFPSWERAHPNRYIVHNGEINTIRGNVNWMKARQKGLKSVYFEEMEDIYPIVDESGSDSSMFDNSLEFLHMTGRSLPEAVMMMIPEPWEHHQTMDQQKKDFYAFHNYLMEPWDGPAAMAFTDGHVIGGVLDRNGLRPSRYYVTKNQKVIMASEVGVLDIPPQEILYKGRLEPGKMLLIDTVAQRLISDEEIKRTTAAGHPYGRWCQQHIIELPHEKAGQKEPLEEEALLGLQKAFGYTYEDVMKTLLPMAVEGEDPVGAMGMDSPLAVLSDNPQPLYLYFKQLFAQVTNPPIDGLREELITSSSMLLGGLGHLLEPEKEGRAAYFLKHPILSNGQLEAIRQSQDPRLKSETLSILYPMAEGPGAMAAALEGLFEAADKAIEAGAAILILSDRGVNAQFGAIPSLLAASGLHHHLVRREIRIDVGLVLESGEPREVHHFCALVGYGVTAVNPYLVFDTLRDFSRRDLLQGASWEKACETFVKASVKGMMKVLTKMGISTMRSYHGAQIFEGIGLGEEVVQRYFTATPSRLGGIGLQEIALENQMRHESAFGSTDSVRRTLEVGGHFQYKKEGELHLYDPESIYLLQRACREGDYGLYKAFVKKIKGSQKLVTLRDLLEWDGDASQAIPIEEVEPVESIVRKFKTGAMSYGSISQEAHECLAIAMNRLGGKSNTGEGGEDEERYQIMPDGDSKNSAIKQVASGRFGVTSHYLVQAEEIQIKMAQGAKPGEGGQLPGGKVYPEIAKVRHSTPGVTLISPPPHHDIYSIEDLAELIHDLKNANPRARINVKLVSEVGVGTVAAGVAKGKADVILISGYDGGTGASPRTSIRNTGLPWELGLAETHQTLMLNGLRDRVVLETDGKLLTGQDVAMAALLGAEEFGFATTPLIALGCVMMRVCNLNTCPVGVATQDARLRKNFKGKPEHVENFMRFVAQDLREIMASLGFRRIKDMVGRTDRLRVKFDLKHWKASHLDLSPLLHQPFSEGEVGRYQSKDQDHGLEETLDRSYLLPACMAAVREGRKVSARLRIKNVHRVVGTQVGSEISRIYGAQGLPEDTIHLSFEGSAGQSFGAFAPTGMTLELEGDANDYLGKGLSGGKIMVYPPKKADFEAGQNILIGNVAFYGATQGQAYICGVAGERFCVRNSGVHSVVEGVGDHGCEYMTGGRVVILGPTGRNFAAGMSGGIAYVLDFISERCNQEMVLLESLVDDQDQAQVKGMLEAHVKYTGSKQARDLLDHWEDSLSRWTKVIPKDYKQMLINIEKAQEAGLEGDEALMKAFEERFKVEQK